jgi:hypothetical protein
MRASVSDDRDPNSAQFPSDVLFRSTTDGVPPNTVGVQRSDRDACLRPRDYAHRCARWPYPVLPLPFGRHVGTLTGHPRELAGLLQKT